MAIILGSFLAVIAIVTVLMVRFNRRFFLNKMEQSIAEINILKEERTRISYDLHDGIGPALHALRRELFNAGIPALAARVEVISQRLSGVLENILPPDLAREDFSTYLKQYFKNNEALYNCPITFQYKIRNELPNDMKVQIYMMLQEMMHNAMKHAMATRLKIQMLEKKNHLEIITEDNGNGFNIKEIREKGIGLTSLYDRAGILGGRLFCASYPGKGTIYHLEIPIRKWNLSES